MEADDDGEAESDLDWYFELAEDGEEADEEDWEVAAEGTEPPLAPELALGSAKIELANRRATTIAEVCGKGERRRSGKKPM